MDGNSIRGAYISLCALGHSCQCRIPSKEFFGIPQRRHRDVNLQKIAKKLSLLECSAMVKWSRNPKIKLLKNTKKTELYSLLQHNIFREIFNLS